MRRWADGGRIESRRTSGGHRRFRLADVQRLSSEVAGIAAPALREVPWPEDPLAELADLMDLRGDALADLASRSLYDSQRVGWFASPGGHDPLHHWVRDLSAAVRKGDWDAAADATRGLLERSNIAGSSLIERHGFLERFSEATVRTLQKQNADQRVIVETRRLFWNFLRLALGAADA
jgi:hypothetical protein